MPAFCSEHVTGANDWACTPTNISAAPGQCLASADPHACHLIHPCDRSKRRARVDTHCHVRHARLSSKQHVHAFGHRPASRPTNKLCSSSLPASNKRRSSAFSIGALNDQSPAWAEGHSYLTSQRHLSPGLNAISSQRMLLQNRRRVQGI